MIQKRTKNVSNRIILAFLICFVFYDCNLRVVQREKVLSKIDGWLMIPTNGNMLFLNNQKGSNDQVNGFYIGGKHGKELVLHLIRLDFDSCMTAILNKEDYLHSDSLSSQSFLYDCTRINFYAATIYYVNEETSKWNRGTERLQKKFEQFNFKINTDVYRARIDRDFRIHVICVKFKSKCY